MKPDFSGYATRSGILCSDGRTIQHGAFKHQDGASVPLVWNHMHDSPDSVLGHAVLSHREDGVYADCYLNETPQGKNTKELVRHGDVVSLSIFANRLQERNRLVAHGQIREVSIVLAGANPGAYIENVVEHGETDEDQAIIYSGDGVIIHSEEGAPVEHADTPKEEEEVTVEEVEETSEDNKVTVKDVFDSLTEEQRQLMDSVVGAAIEATREETLKEVEEEVKAKEAEAKQSDITPDSDENLEHKELDMATATRNVFDQTEDTSKEAGATLSHADIQSVFADAKKSGSLKEAVLAHAATYGIEDIDTLFPDAHLVSPEPALVTRNLEWVHDVLTKVHHTPFSRIKTLVADLTQPEARAKGYIKGTKKADEVFKLLKRVTNPTTIYKKQKLDRDDLADIDSFDVVAWLKKEMRLMLDEEIARAILFGDGRAADDPDKINEDSIRPVATDDPLYTVPVTLGAGDNAEDVIDKVLASRTLYKGTGRPDLFVSDAFLTSFLTSRDTTGRRLYKDETEVATAMRVGRVIPVDAEVFPEGLVAVLVNLRDYWTAHNNKGAIHFFDDFDLDYNQNRYLIETRLAGALVLPHSAVAFWGVPGTNVSSRFGVTINGPVEVTGTIKALMDEGEVNSRELAKKGLLGGSNKPVVEVVTPDNKGDNK